MLDNIIEKFTCERHHLILDADSVIRALIVINSHHDSILLTIRKNLDVGCCGWKDNQKWFINFTTTIDKWNQIVKDLEIIRVWNIADIPEGYLNGKIYSQD